MNAFLSPYSTPYSTLDGFKNDIIIVINFLFEEIFNKIFK